MGPVITAIMEYIPGDRLTAASLQWPNRWPSQQPKDLYTIALGRSVSMALDAHFPSSAADEGLCHHPFTGASAVNQLAMTYVTRTTTNVTSSFGAPSPFHSRAVAASDAITSSAVAPFAASANASTVAV